MTDDLSDIISPAGREADEVKSLVSVIGLLRKWLPCAPMHFSSSSIDGPAFKLLKNVAAGRVPELLIELDKSRSMVDHKIAERLRLYGSWNCPQAAGMGKAWAKSLYGWIGVEMGNTTWKG